MPWLVPVPPPLIPGSFNASDGFVDLLKVDNLTLVDSVTVSSKGSYTQLTSASTDVPVTTSAGQVTTVSLATLTTVSESFNITSSSILSTSLVSVTLEAYSGTPLTQGIPVVSVASVSAGSANIVISNYGANALSGTVKFNYLIF